VCPHCDVRLDNIRCVRCYSLQQPGSFSCARCGQALELEPMLDATDAPCPRCRTPLEAGASGARDRAAPPEPGRGEDDRVHECPRCGGMFVPPDALAEILCRAEMSGVFPDPSRRRLGSLDEVTYLPCPLCHTSMNRVNFGRVSGVIVDVCRVHGTWFDGGELTRVVAFAASGGLAKTRAREREEKKAREAKRSALHVELGALAARDRIDDRLTAWREFLDSLLW
jgi:Zn-finger nucleic acid-binding protein